MNDLRRLLGYLRPHVLTFVLAIAAMLFTALFETAIGALLVPLLDQFQPAASKNTETLFGLQNLIPDGRGDWYGAWLAITGLLIAFTIAKGISGFFSQYLMAKIGQTVILDLRKELYDHILSQASSFFERHRTNFLVSRLVTSCAALELAVSANVRDLLRESFLLLAFVSAAFYFNWRLMLAALVIIPILALLTSRFSIALKKLSETALKGNQRLTDTAQEALSNQMIVKAYRAEEREKSRFQKVAETIARANLRSGRIAAFSPPTLEIIGAAAVVFFFYFGLREINSGAMESPQFFAFLFFLFRSYEPMRKISRQHNEISRALAAARDVWDVLDDVDRLPVAAEPVILGPLEKGLEINGVSFSYSEDGGRVLKDVTLSVGKGEMVAIVGESGSGKSSLVRLVQRFYDPTQGSILWDGTDIRDADLASLKKQISLVTQETALFNDTVYNNISYGNPESTPEDVREAARVALAVEFIENLPDKFDASVGERGSILSGGQRQRIAIARAVLMNASLLILDEATSALDAESEALVQQALANLQEGRTSIVIAHRLSTVRRADKIAVMSAGSIVETGTHDELISRGGMYKRLYDMQFAETG